MYDLNKLTPEEKDSLLNQLLSKYDNEVSTPGLHGAHISGTDEMSPDHGDEAEDLEMLEPFAKVLELLIDKVEELEARLAKNESLVIDDLFGGIDKMYKDNVRAKGIDDIRGKYGDLFAPHIGALKELAPDEDLYETLHDMIAPLREQEGWNDEQEFNSIKGAADAIAQKLAKIKGTGIGESTIEGEGEVKPAVEVEVTKTSALSPEAAFLDKVKEMKKKASAKGLA